ncbi:Transposase, MuDR, plant [Sesbania bispinosa]|nr:Transposase, MuDR, plant [Sesbania bispinosa]
MCRQFKFKLGMEFSSLKEFKDAILEHSVLNGREIIFEKNDKVRARVRCSQTCDFVALVSKVGGSSTYRMKTLNSTHTCGRVLNNKNAKSKWVATKVADRFRSGQGVRLVDIIGDIRTGYAAGISVAVAWKAKKLAKKMVEGDTAKQYSLLWPATEEPTAPNETQSQRPATEEPTAPNYTQPNANTNSEGVGNQGNQGKTPQASNVVSASTAQPTKRRGRPPTKNKTTSKNPQQKGNDQESNQPIGTQQSTTSHVAAAITPTTPVAATISPTTHVAATVSPTTHVATVILPNSAHPIGSHTYTTNTSNPLEQIQILKNAHNTTMYMQSKTNIPLPPALTEANKILQQLMVIAQDVTFGNSYDWKNVANQLGQSKNEGYMNFMTHVEEAKKFCAENGFEPTAATEGGGTQSEVNSTGKNA